MLVVYKKLPGTNCRKCGELTCTAFAIKVTGKKRAITDCPFVSEDGEGASSQMKTVTMDDNYNRVSGELEKEAIQTDFKKVADAIGGDYECNDGAEIIRIKLINKIYEMRKDGLFENNEYCEDSWTKIIIYDYVRRKGGVPLTGEWIMLGNFRDTASHVKAFQSKAEDKVAETFNERFNELKVRCEELKGVVVEGEMNADYVCRFGLLPRVPMYMCYWDADEEFKASCKLYVDSSAEEYIDIEYLAYLLEKFVDIFIEGNYFLGM